MVTVPMSDVDSDIGERLNKLQEISSLLEPDAANRQTMLAKVASYTEAFADGIGERPVYQPPEDAAATLEALKVSEQPEPIDNALKLLDDHVTTLGHGLGSDRFFAYIPSGGLYSAALGDFIAAVINRYAGVGHAGPGAARLEQSLLDWLAKMFGYPDSAEGDLTSGGSMAALSAIITAREACGIASRNVPSAVVYITSQTHHTFSKALRIAGLGDCVVRDVPTDDFLRMDAAALQGLIEADREAGLNPWLVAATAGTTDVGAVDPLDAIADVAKAAHVWFHVDAAYGGAFALCDEGKSRLSGIERSDSLIFDPHKGFFLPCGSGVVLVREGDKMRNAFHARGVYMQDMVDDPERSACDLSPELTRPFRGLRLWLPLKVLGIAPFRAALEEKLLLAEYFRDRMQEQPHCELGPGPDLSIVTFRYVPESAEPNEFNRKLVHELRADGRVFLTSTTIDSKYTIRMAILGYNSHLASVDTAIAVIAEKAAELMSI